MEMFTKILMALLFGGMAYFFYRRLKNNPELLEKSSLSKSATTIGVLGIILIAFVAFLVMMLKSGR